MTCLRTKTGAARPSRTRADVPCPGDLLLLYTDGVIECVGTSGSRFGADGLQRALYGRYDNAQTMLDHVVDVVETFRNGVELSDDLTLVVLRVSPEPAAA